MATATRSEKLDLRLTAEAKRVLNAAAQASRRSVSEFVLESALARAQETLPDRQHFGLDAVRWEAFLAASMRHPSQCRDSRGSCENQACSRKSRPSGDDVPHREAPARSSRRRFRLRQGTAEPLPDPLRLAKPAFQQFADLSGFLGEEWSASTRWSTGTCTMRMRRSGYARASSGIRSP